MSFKGWTFENFTSHYGKMNEINSVHAPNTSTGSDEPTLRRSSKNRRDTSEQDLSTSQTSIEHHHRPHVDNLPDILPREPSLRQPPNRPLTDGSSRESSRGSGSVSMPGYGFHLSVKVKF